MFLALRAHALSGGKYILVIPIFLLNASFITPNIVSGLPQGEVSQDVAKGSLQYMISKLHAQVLPAFIGCQSVLSWDTDFSVRECRFSQDSVLCRLTRSASKCFADLVVTVLVHPYPLTDGWE